MSKHKAFAAEVDALVTSSYDGVAVHEKMIKDDIRTRSYLDAIENNPELFKDKIALDIGCGTGILSLFAARAGAKHVYAVDISSMIERASMIAKVNGLSDKITFIQGRVEDVDLPKVDVIVSEWMGFCLMSEFNLDCVLKARDRSLAAGGLMLPNKTSLHIVVIEDAEKRKEKIDYWDNVYGLDFSPLKPELFRTGFLGTPSKDTVLSQAVCVLDLDLQVLQASETSIYNSIPFRLAVNRKGTAHAFLAWFDYHFTGGHQEVQISTGPFSPPTHWKQTVFYLEPPIEVEKSDAITGLISFEQCERDLIVRISYEIEAKAIRGSGWYKVGCME